MPRDSQRDKASRLLEYLVDNEKPSCMLASLIPDSPEKHPEVCFCVVVPPKPLHFFYLTKRYLLHLASPNRSGTPDWYRWKDVIGPRRRMLEFSSQFDLPVFNNLKQAIAWAEQKASETPAE